MKIGEAISEAILLISRRSCVWPCGAIHETFRRRFVCDARVPISLRVGALLPDPRPTPVAGTRQASAARPCTRLSSSPPRRPLKSAVRTPARSRILISLRTVLRRDGPSRNSSRPPYVFLSALLAYAPGVLSETANPHGLLQLAE